MKTIIIEQLRLPTLEEINVFNASVQSRSRKNIKAYKNTLDPFTQMQKDIIVGKLLGDASIPCPKKNGQYVMYDFYAIKFEHKYTQLELMLHFYKGFEPFVGTGPKLRIIKKDFHFNYGVSVWFRTYTIPHLTLYENAFYTIKNNKRVKRIPKNLPDFLTPRALAHWYIDDGSFWDKNFWLNTQGFSYDEQLFLIEVLKQVFDLDFHIARDRKYYRLVLAAGQEVLFASLIGPFLEPFEKLYYKLGSYLHQGYYYKLK